MTATRADLNRAIDRAKDKGLVVREIRMADDVFNDLFKDSSHVIYMNIPVTPDLNAPPGTLYLFTATTQTETKPCHRAS